MHVKGLGVFVKQINMNKELKKKILELRDVDQEARFACKPDKITFENYRVFLIDMANNDFIKNKIIKSYGYPTQDLIGKEGMKAFWLLIQHQDRDIELQKECLENCDFEPKEKALLTDRILYNQGKKLKYGTLSVGESVKDVDKNRKEIGLEPLDKK